MSAVRILVVADDPLARAGLAVLLADQEGVKVVGRIGGTDDLAAALSVHRPDVVLWDMGWDAETALARLAESRIATPIAVLAAGEEDALAGWRTGVQGILRRDAGPASVAAAVIAVAQGLLVIDAAYRSLPAGSPSLREPAPWPQEDETMPPEELTAREREILDISEHTVKFHVNAILGKLGASSRTEAVVRATRLGLIFL